MTDELKTAFEGVQKVVGEMRSTFEENLQKRDVLLEERQKKMDEEFVSLRNQMDELAKSAKRAAAVAQPDGFTEEQRQLNEAGRAYLKRGDVSQVLTRATEGTIGSDAQGGYLASPAVIGPLERLQKIMSPVRDYATVVQVGSATYRIPVDRLGTRSNWSGERRAKAKTDTPDLGLFEPSMGIIEAYPQISQELVEDAFVNIEAWIAQSLAEEFGYQEGAAFVNGSGVNRPRGFLTYGTVHQTNPLTDTAFDKVGFVKTGSATALNASAATVGDVFTDAIACLKPFYRANARFFMNRATEAAVAKLKDADNQPLWRMSMRDGLPAQLNGYPIANLDDMPSIGDGNFPIAFGDMRAAYVIVDRVGLSIQRDPFSAKPMIEFFARKRVGGGLKNGEALKFIQTAA